MKLSILTCLACCGLAGGALAQPPRPTDPAAEKADRWQMALRSARLDVTDPRAQMYEDVEILRRILEKELLGLYGLPHGGFWPASASEWLLRQRYLMPDAGATGLSSFWIEPNGPNQLDATARRLSGSLLAPAGSNPNTGPGLPAAEGYYLEGYGIILSIILPPPGDEPQAASNKPKTKPLNRWERTRKELRGEQVKPEEPSEQSGPPSVTETVLKLLAENGHNLAQLPGNEVVTVAITFRPHSAWQTSQAHVDPNRLNLYYRELAAGSKGEGAGAAMTDMAAQPPAASSGAGVAATARDYELLGDLHLRQGQPVEAEKAFRKGLEANPEPKLQAALYRKLAQTYLAQGKDAEAKEALNQVAALNERGQLTDWTAASGKPSHQALPQKLIITVPRKALSDVAEGRMGYEEFKKTVKRERLQFPPPAADKPQGGAKPKR